MVDMKPNQTKPNQTHLPPISQTTQDMLGNAGEVRMNS